VRLDRAIAPAAPARRDAPAGATAAVASFPRASYAA
jgi:hypothetical protein